MVTLMMVYHQQLRVLSTDSTIDDNGATTTTYRIDNDDDDEEEEEDGCISEGTVTATDWQGSRRQVGFFSLFFFFNYTNVHYSFTQLLL